MGMLADLSHHAIHQNSDDKCDHQARQLWPESLMVGSGKRNHRDFGGQNQIGSNGTTHDLFSATGPFSTDATLANIPASPPYHTPPPRPPSHAQRRHSHRPMMLRATSPMRQCHPVILSSRL